MPRHRRLITTDRLEALWNDYLAKSKRAQESGDFNHALEAYSAYNKFLEAADHGGGK